MQNDNDDYLTEYYQDGTGDQFFPGCPSSIWFQRNPEGNRFFFSSNGTEEKDAMNQNDGNHREESVRRK